MIALMLCDAHAHIGDEAETRIRIQSRIPTMLCGTDPENALLVEEYSKKSELFFPSFGLHPWKSASCPVEAMLPFLEKAPVIGEIGMDQVWCDVPVDRQKEAFIAQLEVAKRLFKPVILHTKGCEKEIAQIISGYDLPFIVHWYSCESHLELYLQKDCFFTLGPDIRISAAVQTIAEKASLSRLMIETDGMSAVAWAQNRQVSAGELPLILEDTLDALAQIKKIPVQAAADAVFQNFQRMRAGKLYE